MDSKLSRWPGTEEAIFIASTGFSDSSASLAESIILFIESNVIPFTKEINSSALAISSIAFCQCWIIISDLFFESRKRISASLNEPKSDSFCPDSNAFLGP